MLVSKGKLRVLLVSTLKPELLHLDNPKESLPSTATKVVPGGDFSKGGNGEVVGNIVTNHNDTWPPRGVIWVMLTEYHTVSFIFSNKNQFCLYKRKLILIDYYLKQ